MRLYLYLCIILIGFLSISFSYANSNGIWTYPEDIRAGVFGADENLDSSDNYTFNNIVYFNRDLVASNIQISHNISVGDSLEVQNNIFASRFRSIDNPSFFLNPSGSSTLYAIFAEAYFTSGMGNTYYLRPAQLSIVHSLRVDNNLDLRGEMVNGTVPWARLVDHPSIDAGTGLIGGGDLSQSRTIELDLDFTDERYVNIVGDIMQGDLNMNNNRITNISLPSQNSDVVNKEYVDSNFVSIPPLCNEDNQALGWDGSTWVCNTIQSMVSSGGGVYARDDLLVNEIHTVGDCLDLGGQISVDDGDLFCRLDLNNCPSGWSRFKQWGAYLPRPCGMNQYCGGCTTRITPWANSGAPSCTYRQVSGDDNCMNRRTCTATQRSQIGCY